MHGGHRLACEHAWRTEEVSQLLDDVGLPDGSGYDVTTALRTKSDAPAVAMSGHGMDADRARTRDAGFTGPIVKPVSAEVLRDVLDRFSIFRP